MKRMLFMAVALVWVTLVYPQTEIVPLSQVKQVADQQAQLLWGEVQSSEPLAYFSKEDELIGYRFTYSLGKEFPEEEILLQQCRNARIDGNRQSQWGIDEYGTIFLSCRTDMAVIQDYSTSLSPYFAMGSLMQEKVTEQISGNITLKKAYYIDFQNQWFCYTNGNEDIYIKVFPDLRLVDQAGFHQIVDPLGSFCATGDFSSEWEQYLNNLMDAPSVQVWIPNHDGNCRFYDWSYGCSPTAAAMLLSYWDYISMISSSNYSKLIDYYFQRWDGIQGETDYQVPNTNKELAIAMNTDTITSGSTARTNIAPGYASVCNSTNGYNFTCTHHDHGTDYVWYFTKIVSEIGTYGRPVHISIPGHSECCVAYDAATNFIGVHNTWYEGVQWISRTQLERVYTIVPGGASGLGIELTYPLGDVLYNHNGSGETLYCGDVYQISWDYDFSSGSYVKIYYSINGGYNWYTITSNTPNDGKHDWLVPAGINSTACRIRLRVYNSSNVYSGEDASLGNLKILAGGSLQVLSEDVSVTTVTDPDYYQFTSTSGYWNVVGVRPNVSGEDWDIELYSSTSFATELASSTYGVSTVDFVVLDGNHSPSVARGIKAYRYAGSGTGKVEFEGGANLLTVGTPVTETWTAGDVVEMWDVYLTPGEYKCTMVVNSGTANLGIALYGSSGAAYYAGRNSYLAISDAGGSGVNESFWITITTADYYGLCIFANDANSASITLQFETPGQWLGMVSHDWYTADNWSAAFIPIATTDVTINSGYTYYPTIGSGDAYCNQLSIGAGAKVSVGNGDLNVSGNLTVFGQVEQTHYNADVFLSGDIYWESGSTANIIANGEFHVAGDWEFRSGANVQLANGDVYFTGTSTSYMRIYDASCSFQNIINLKTSSSLYFSNSSTDTLKINGDLNNESTLYLNADKPLVLKDQFTNTGHIYGSNSDGTFIFDGNTHTINLNTGDYFNHVIISSTGNTTLADSLRIEGDLTIQSGTLAAGTYPVLIEGDWINNVGAGGFNEGTGKVVFNGGNYHQYCSDETFYTLEVNKTLGGAFRMNGTHVVCQSYDWSAGAVDVLSGSFTANDLADNGISGSFYLNPGGTINLTNTDGFIDLLGYLYISGGDFNIWRGNGYTSWWPNTTNAGITMSAGTLEFKDVGVLIIDVGFSLTENITGGTIRTPTGFRVERADFSPAGGTIEFYGSANGTFHTINGGSVNHILVNKTGIASGPEKSTQSELDKDGNPVNEAPLVNTITCTNMADINGNLTIQSGTLLSNDQTIYLAGNWSDPAGPTGFDETTGKVVFDGSSSADILTSETFYDLELNKTYPSWNGLDLIDDVTCTNDLHIIDGSMELNNPANLSVTGNLTIELNAGLNANDVYNLQIYVGENWTNLNTTFSDHYGFDPGVHSTVTFHGTIDQYLTKAGTEELFHHLVVDKSSGKFRPNDNITCGGNITINTGIWEDQVTSLVHTLTGDFTVQPSGSFFNAFPKNTVRFIGPCHSLLTYSGNSGYFYHLTILKTTGFSVTQVGNTSCQYSGVLTVDEGDYNLNGYHLFLSGGAEINDGGKLLLPEGSTLSILNSYSINVNSGGILDIQGTSADPVTISANIAANRYNLTINPGGTISADYGIFKQMTLPGVNVQSGAFVDPAHAFTGCTFQDGTAGGTLLTLNTNQGLTIHDAVFPTNTWSGSSNVSKTINQGHINFIDFSGGFSGEAYDADPFDLIDWVPYLTANATATPESICLGTSSQLHANPSGGVPPYTFLWSPAGSLSDPNIEDPLATPVATTSYHVEITDALGSMVSDDVTVTVNPLLPVSVSIDVSQNPVPPGTFVIFTATPVNGGSSPSYQWKVNGINIGTGLSTLTYIPSNGDEVYCIMTSNEPCVTGNPATSNSILMIVVPTNTLVTGIVPSPLTLCFDATNTITVAGGGNTFLVQNGGSVTMIAGVRIEYLPGTTVEPGGYMHGYITTTHSYCGSLPPSLPEVATALVTEYGGFALNRYIIYPNPTTGMFTIEQKEGSPGDYLLVELYGLRGEKLYINKLNQEKKHILTISDIPPGMYILKVISGDHTETFKLIKTD